MEKQIIQKFPRCNVCFGQQEVDFKYTEVRKRTQENLSQKSEALPIPGFIANSINFKAKHIRLRRKIHSIDLDVQSDLAASKSDTLKIAFAFPVARSIRYLHFLGGITMLYALLDFCCNIKGTNEFALQSRANLPHYLESEIRCFTN